MYALFHHGAQVGPERDTPIEAAFDYDRDILLTPRRLPPGYEVRERRHYGPIVSCLVWGAVLAFVAASWWALRLLIDCLMP